MIFQSFLLDVNESNAYIVACDITRDAILVDAGDFDARIRDFIEQEGLNLTAVLITHDHYDHTSGLREIHAAYDDLKIFAGSSSAGQIAAKRVAHGAGITIGALRGTVLATPGHTPDSVSLSLPGIVFTGDALFAGSVGGTSSKQSAAQQIEAITKNILTLPADTEIHPGHGPASTVAIERAYNPFLAPGTA